MIDEKKRSQCVYNLMYESHKRGLLARLWEGFNVRASVYKKTKYIKLAGFTFAVARQRSGAFPSSYTRIDSKRQLISPNGIFQATRLGKLFTE
jgi:hypothetical protein